MASESPPHDDYSQLLSSSQTLEQDLSQLPPAQLLRITVLYHPQWDRVGDWLQWTLPPVLPPATPIQTIAEFQLSRQQPLFQSMHQAPGRDLGDPYLSRRPLLLKARADGSLIIERFQCPSPLAVNGAVLDQSGLVSAQELAQGVVVCLAQRVILHIQRFSQTALGPGYQGPDYGLAGAGPALDRVRDSIQRLANVDLPVLIRGESGTGKELVARALHQASQRSRGPFVAVNAAAIPASLAAAEIFGAQRGAYTGSTQNRRGYLAQAGDGSLFLDEVGDLPAEVQVLLLRVLETRQYQSLGASEYSDFKARLIAATDVDLESAMDQERFRSSLYHRLSAVEIRLPALREQTQNLGLILYQLLQQEAASLGLSNACFNSRPAQAAPWLPAAWMARLALAPWPGNVRQLRNVARQLLLLGQHLECLDQEPRLAALVDELCQSSRSKAAAVTNQRNTEPGQPAQGAGDSQIPDPPGGQQSASTGRQPNAAQRLRQLSDEELLRLLVEHDWRVLRLASSLSVPRSSLYDRIRQSPLLEQALETRRVPDSD